MQIRVESYAGYRGMAMPRAFRLLGRDVDVIETLDQWYGPDYRYIKVKGDDGNLYILRLNEPHAAWELTMFQRARAQFLAAPFYRPRRGGQHM